MDDLMKQAFSILAVTPERWQGIARALPDDLLRRKPVPGEWSAVECLQHLVDSERVFQFRVNCFLEGKDFPGFDPDWEGTNPGERPTAELADELAGLREESLKTLEMMGEADLERKVRHQELGLVQMGEMINEWAAHDLNHTIQAERALMQPLLAGCGPWSVYFKDHFVDETFSALNGR